MTTPESSSAPVQPRRQVLCGLALALAVPGVVAAACGSSDSSASSTPTKTTGGGSGAAGGGGAALAALSDIPVGGGTVVSGSDGKVLLVRPADNEVKAFSAVCPHRGATVGTPVNGVVTCPAHGSQFDGTTGALRHGPATQGLTPVPVKIQGQQVVQA